MDSDNSKPREKWVDKLTVISPDPEQQEALRRIFSNPLPDMRGVEDLEKTPVELRLIREVMEAVSRFTTELGLEPFRIHEARIHILDPEEYVRQFNPETYGISNLGHAYLPRQPDMVLFTHVLAHEIAHLIGYAEMLVDATHGIDDAERLFAFRRHGLIDARSRPYRFEGMNEGATEMACMVILRTLTETTEFFDEAEKRRLSSRASYYIHLMLIDALLAFVAERKGCEGSLLGTMLLLDFMKGTDVFLGHLDEVLPGATETLAGMETTEDDGLRVILELGFHELWNKLSDWLVFEQDDRSI